MKMELPEPTIIKLQNENRVLKAKIASLETNNKLYRAKNAELKLANKNISDTLSRIDKVLTGEYDVRKIRS